MERRAQVGQLLRGYRPGDPQEAVFCRRMLELAQGPDDPFSSRRFDPGHFTASAYILSPDCGSVLLIRHPKLGRWLQPGGHVEPADADLLATARREAAEETGLGRLSVESSSPLDLDIHRIPARGEAPSHLHFDVRFLFRATTLQVAPDQEVRVARWVAVSELPTRNAEPAMARVAAKLE